MKDTSSNQELFQYYNERAAEYEAFYYGKFPTPHPDPDIYNKDRLPIQSLLPGYISGRCIDIACGTGFWLPFYHPKCSNITLIDQSAEMLKECAKKIQHLGIDSKARIVRGDIFSHSPTDHSFDSAVIGFLISHFNETDMARFFPLLRSLLTSNGKFVVIDSLWNKKIKAFRLNKAGMNMRTLFNGREFQIYKHFFTKSDIREMAKTYNTNLKVVYWGKVFFAAVGQFIDGQA